MHDSRLGNWQRFALGNALLIALGLTSTGCQEMTGAAMEYALENSSPEDKKQAAILMKFKAEQAQCPKKIDEHTTLESVKMRGIARVRYHYVVSESGRAEVNMNHTRAVTQSILERTLESPTAAAIVANDMGVEHFFVDREGKCMLSVTINKKDVQQLRMAKRKAAKLAQIKVEAPKLELSEAQLVSAAEEEEEEEEKILMPKKHVGMSRNDKNPAGVQSNPFAK